HQTGVVMDVTSEDIDFDINEDFADTEEGKWLKDHAHEFGFIIRYPEEKEDITQYQYEPWHIRYVGKQAAETIYENEATLEEYFDVYSKEKTIATLFKRSDGFLKSFKHRTNEMLR